MSEAEQMISERVAEGRTHLYKAEIKEGRRTPAHPDHTAGPS
jgi:hypothetical protein